jgi:hypothetical protein
MALGSQDHTAIENNNGKQCRFSPARPLNGHRRHAATTTVSADFARTSIADEMREEHRRRVLGE